MNNRKRIEIICSTLALSLGWTIALNHTAQVHAHINHAKSHIVYLHPKMKHRRLVIKHHHRKHVHVPHTHAKAYVVMNRKTGQIIAQKNPNQRRLVASTSKLMTFYLAEQKLARHPNAWHHKLRFSRSLVSMGYNPDFDGFRANIHKRYTVGQIFKAAFIGSDDNAAIRLGEWVGGNNTHFIHLMNRQARQWHLRANFTSASGLENNDLAPYGLWVKGSRYGGNEVSAKSLAIITYHLINEYPSIMKYSKMRSAYVRGNKLINENGTLKGTRFYDKSLRPDGLKTGYTPRAGLCFVGTSHRGDGLITVILHDDAEFGDSNKLMHFGYHHMR